MMSTPAGWYPQPDGRQRWWDGNQWTEHFHDPSAPAATPAASTTGDGPAATTAGSTTYGSPAGSYSSPQTTSYPYGQGAHQQTTYGQPAQGTATYGQPGGAYATPQPAKSNVGKGCLIAAGIAAVLVALVVIAAIVLFNRAKDTIEEQLPSGFPTSTSLPSLGIPDSGGEKATAKIGDAFTVGEVKVAAGWSLSEKDAIGFTKIENMKTEAPIDGIGFLEIEILNGSQSLDTTICTVESGTTNLQCMPFTDDTTGATEIVATKTF